jgi:diguanylate cyclase (GGDEF)-like protein/PAS domain S-box-containing protein
VATISPAAATPDGARPSRGPGAGAYLVLALGLMFAIAGWRFAGGMVTRNAGLELKERTGEASRALEQHIRGHVDALLRLQGALESANEVTRSDFARYAQSGVLGGARSGFATLQFARHIPGQDRANFLASVRADRGLGDTGYPNFSIRPDGERPEYLVIDYLEPVQGAEELFGLDLLGDPSTRAAAERARDTGDVAASAPVLRKGSPTSDWRFSLYLPIYRMGAPRQTPVQRRMALTGLVGAEMRITDLLQPLLGAETFRHLHVLIRDIGPIGHGGTATNGVHAVALFDSRAAGEDMQGTGSTPEDIAIDVAGRRWIVTLLTRPSAATSAQVALPWAVLIGGVCVSLLLFGLAWSFSRSRDSAMALATRMTEDLRESEARARVVAEMLPIPMVVMDAEDGRILRINRRAGELFGITPLAAEGTPVQDYCENAGECKRMIARVRREGQVRDYEMRLKSASGEPVWVLLSAETTQYEGKPVLLMAMIDISERTKAEQALKTSEERFRLIAETVSDLIAVLDPEGHRLYNNPAYAHILGHTDRLVGTDSFEEIHPDDRERIRRLFFDTVASGQGHRAQYRFLLRDGVVRYIESQGNAILDEGGKVDRVVVISRDITEAKLAEEKIHHLAHHDALTGLPNRILLRDRLEQALAHGQRNNRQVGLLFLDLDGFKNINDTLGHETGDCLLQTLSERLVKCVRRVDTVARLGGDEFVVVLPAIKGPGDVEQVARKILEAVTAPAYIEDHTLEVTCSVGGTVYPHDGTDGTTLMKNADAAMYRAKELGRNRYQRFVARVESEAEVPSVTRLRS